MIASVCLLKDTYGQRCWEAVYKTSRVKSLYLRRSPKSPLPSMLTHLTLAILAGLAEASPFRRWASPVVDLGYATYQGSYNETSNIQSFLGIKYGADTSGERDVPARSTVTDRDR